MSANETHNPSEPNGPGDATAAPPPAAEKPATDPSAAGETTDDGKRWYVVHTYSGHESRARMSLLERVKAADKEDLFGEILIPTESVIEVRKGQKRTTTRKFYPGYMFVRMKLTRESWHLVKGTPKVTGFLGGNTPSPVPDREIAQVKRQETEGAAKPKPKVLFEEGETVRVTDGPFSNFSGIVEEVKPEKQKIRVLVSIFGRATPVELDFSQVEKS